VLPCLINFISDGTIYLFILQETFLIYSFGLTILWCAEYAIGSDEPISWSSDLQSLVTSMCEEPRKISLAFVYNRSCGSALPGNDSDVAIIVELCQSIVGSITEVRDIFGADCML